MSDTTQKRLRALALFSAPVVLMVGWLYHPYVADETKVQSFADAASSDPDRWAGAHIILVIGFVLASLAVLAARHELRSAGEERWSPPAVLLLVTGHTLLVGIWFWEVDVAAVAKLGGDTEAVLLQSGTYGLEPLALAGFLMMGIGWILLALALYRSRILQPIPSWSIAGLMVPILAGLLTPSTGGSYIFGVGVLGFMWLLAYRILVPRSNSRPGSDHVAVGVQESTL